MDFGLYGGLQRKSNIFETKAQNRQMEMQIMQTMEQRSEAKLAKDAEVDAKMQEYFQSMSQLDVLEQDKDRISAADKELRMDVLQKVKQYGGNLTNFMYGGGAATLQAYQSNLLESDAVRGAIANKTNKAQWDHAQANGLFVKDVSVDVSMMDPETGQMKKENRVVTMNEAYELFEKGAIDKLPYDGAEKDIDVGPEIFQKLYKDPRDPYSQDTEVSKQDIYNWVFEHGGSDGQARKKADQYATMVKQGATEWRYQSGDMLKKKLMEAQIQGQYLSNSAARARAKAGATPSNKTITLNSSSRIDNLKNDGKDAAQIFPEEKTFIAESLGLHFDEETGMYVKKPGGQKRTGSDWYEKGANENPADYDLTMFKSLDPISWVKDPRTGAVSVKFYAEYDSKGAGSFDEPMHEDYFFGEDRNEGGHANNFQKTTSNWGNDSYGGEITVDISNEFNTWGKTYLNDQVGLKSAAAYVPNSGFNSTTGELEYNLRNKVDQAAQVLMESYGLTYNEAINTVMNGVREETNDNGMGNSYQQQFEMKNQTR